MVVVDLDDTLYLERDYVFSGFAAVEEWAAHQGMPGLGLRCAELFREGVRGSVFDQALIEVGLPVDRGMVRELVDVYRKHRPDIQLEPDAADFLERCREDGVRLAMITGGPVESQTAKIAALQLAAKVEQIVFARSWGEDFDKPHDRAFEFLESSTGLRQGQLIYVGDNPKKDYVPATARGWQFVRIRRSGSVHEDVETPVGVPEYPNLTDWWGAFSSSSS